MEAKLIKVGDHYDLYYRDEEENIIIGFASTDGTFERKLSIEKCRDIEQQLPNQTKWDVDVEMDIYCIKDFVDDGNTHIISTTSAPKIDENGYLILKRL
jgi:hypothetical protein